MDETRVTYVWCRRLCHAGKVSLRLLFEVSVFSHNDRLGAPNSYEDEEAFISNLKLRFDNNMIYTYIRGVCISVNPYQDLGIYTGLLIDEYYGTQVG